MPHFAPPSSRNATSVRRVRGTGQQRIAVVLVAVLMALVLGAVWTSTWTAGDVPVRLDRPTSRSLIHGDQANDDLLVETDPLLFIAIPAPAMVEGGMTACESLARSWAHLPDAALIDPWKVVIVVFTEDGVDSEEARKGGRLPLADVQERCERAVRGRDGPTVSVHLSVVGLNESACGWYCGRVGESADVQELMKPGIAMGGNAVNHEMMRYAVREYPRLRYYLRLDDDSFVCLPRLIAELSERPLYQFVWGSFHCAWGTRPDESFILMSSDILRFTSRHLGTTLRNFDDREIFDVNFGYYLHMLRVDLHDDKELLVTIPTTTARPDKLAYLQTLTNTSSPLFLANGPSVCDAAVLLHPVKSPDTLAALQSMVKLRPSTTYLSRVTDLSPPHCEHLVYVDGHKRPGRLPSFDIPFSSSIHGSTQYSDPLPGEKGACCLKGGGCVDGVAPGGCAAGGRFVAGNTCVVCG